MITEEMYLLAKKVVESCESKQLNKPDVTRSKIYVVELGNVVRGKDGYKKVVKKHNIDEIKENLNNYEFVCDRAHGDGDFSYMCGMDWCRCCQ